MEARRRRKASVEGDVQMTSMIDVVFQLLIYFVVTIKPMDVSARLDVLRPTGAPPDANAPPPKMIQISVFPDGFLINGKDADLKALGDILMKLGQISETQTVVISCAKDSPHDKLIGVLDRCARAKLRNLSVVSMN